MPQRSASKASYFRSLTASTTTGDFSEESGLGNMHNCYVKSFEQWRSASRKFLTAQVAAVEVNFVDAWQRQTQFDFGVDEPSREKMGSDSETARQPCFHVPQLFLRLAQHVACHRDPTRWNKLYQVLWRLTHGQPDLMALITDDDVHCLRSWHRQVRRDVHKTKAFVRFDVA